MRALQPLARRRWPKVAIALVAALAALTGALDAGTGFDRQGPAWVDGPQAVPTAAWSRPCWRADRRRGTHYTLPCGRVEGRVLYRQLRDPDGDGDSHLIVLAGRHIVIVKVKRAVDRGGPLPGVGRRVTSVGVLDRGRAGLPVVIAAKIGWIR